MCQFEWGRECIRASWNIGKGWKEGHLTHPTYNFLVAPPPPQQNSTLMTLQFVRKENKKKEK